MRKDNKVTTTIYLILLIAFFPPLFYISNVAADERWREERACSLRPTSRVNGKGKYHQPGKWFPLYRGNHKYQLFGKRILIRSHDKRALCARLSPSLSSHADPELSYSSYLTVVDARNVVAKSEGIDHTDMTEES
jgi:hypothetical protein